MFYVVSKVFWALANPLSLAVLLLIAGLIAALAGWRRSAGTATAAAAVILHLGGWTTAGALLLQPLEDHPPRSRMTAAAAVAVPALRRQPA
ncbi:MAG: YdcF family protein, partial [Nitratireductor sp.]